MGALILIIVVIVIIIGAIVYFLKKQGEEEKKVREEHVRSGGSTRSEPSVVHIPRRSLSWQMQMLIP